MANLSKDPQLIHDLESGAPIFAMLAEHVFGRPENAEQADEHRGLGKRGVYAVSYGAGIRRVASMTGMSEHDAEALRRWWFERYPRLQRLFWDLKDEVADRGGVTLPLTGWLPSSRDRGYVGLNLAVQGGCRDFFAERLLALDDAGLYDSLILPIHDEVLVECDEADATEVARVLSDVLPIDAGVVQIPVEASAGRSWGEAYTENLLDDDSLDDPELEAQLVDENPGDEEV